MKRIMKPEIIDLGPEYYTKEEYFTWLNQMERVGRLLGGNRATLKAFDSLNVMPKSILDVGCGGGKFAYILALKYPGARVVGIDISQDAIDYARKKLAKRPISNLCFEYRENPELNEQEKSFDIVTSTLVCHHLDDATIIDFFKRASKVARKAIIINDLERNWVAYYGFLLLSKIMFSNRLIQNDGPLSIRKGFVYNDWLNYLKEAGFDEDRYNISYNWLFRWVVTVKI